MTIKYMTFFDQEVPQEMRTYLPGWKIDSYTPDIIKSPVKVIQTFRYFPLFHWMVFNIYQSFSNLFAALKLTVPKYYVNVFINHGWGTKQLPGKKELEKKDMIRRFRNLRKFTDYVICLSEHDSTYFLNHPMLNDLPLPKFIPLGHPRNDFLVRNKNNQELISEIKNMLGIINNQKVILFAPTHRESVLLGNDYDIYLLDRFINELEGIDNYLFKKNWVLLFRPHYYFSKFPETRFKAVKIVSTTNFKDPRLLMLVSDILITDYSSIFVDFLLLGRPIVFYQPDLEYYQEIRGLAINPENKIHMPGPKLKNLSEIFDVDDEELSKYDLQSSARFFHKYTDDQSTKRLAEFLKKVSTGE